MPDECKIAMKVVFRPYAGVVVGCPRSTHYFRVEACEATHRHCPLTNEAPGLPDRS